MKTVTKRIVISIILSFMLFVLNYNFIRINTAVCIGFAAAVYIVINKVMEDYSDDSFFDELSDDQIEKLSNSQLNNCMYYYERKLLRTRRQIKDPALKAKVTRLAKVIDNAVKYIASRSDRSAKSFFITRSLRPEVNVVSKCPEYEYSKDENGAVKNQLDKISSGMNSFIKKINREYVFMAEPDFEAEEDVIEKATCENILCEKRYARKA